MSLYTELLPPKVSILADSISEAGYRVTTMRVRFHRFVLAEFNTHRVFSRNSASSRAIPLKKQLEMLFKGHAIPISWPAEQPGMQGGSELTDVDLALAKGLWETGFRSAVAVVESYLNTLANIYPDLDERELKSHTLHKSVINRILEPYMYHEVIVTAVEFGNFFEQRCSPLAQPEIRVPAEAMRDAYEASVPVLLKKGEWHLPFIKAEDWEWAREINAKYPEIAEWQIVAAISVARCARVSYLTHEGVRDPLEDVNLYNRLVSAFPPHFSPLEHACTPYYEEYGVLHGNLDGFVQLRHSSCILEDSPRALPIAA